MGSTNWFVNNDMRGTASQSRDRNQHSAMSKRTSDAIRGWRTYLSVIKPRNIGLSVTKGFRCGYNHLPLARRQTVETITLINVRRKRLTRCSIKSIGSPLRVTPSFAFSFPNFPYLQKISIERRQMSQMILKTSTASHLRSCMQACTFSFFIS